MPSSRPRQIPLRELSRYFRVPSRGLPVDYPGREILLASRITNISNNGVFICTRSPFAKGSRVQISFRLPEVDHLITASCVVKWSTASSPTKRPPDYELEGMGLAFSKISRRDRRAIQDYIAAFLERMRQRTRTRSR